MEATVATEAPEATRVTGESPAQDTAPRVTVAGAVRVETAVAAATAAAEAAEPPLGSTSSQERFLCAKTTRFRVKRSPVREERPRARRDRKATAVSSLLRAFLRVSPRDR